MDNALQNVTRLLGKKVGNSWKDRFLRIQMMLGSSLKFRRIAKASEVEQLNDYLAEILYALIFAGLEFKVEIEPLGEKGPDLRVHKDDHFAFVEITRFRRIQTGPPKISDVNPTLDKYGNPLRDIRKSIDKIMGKFRQLRVDESIIAIWNDDGDLEEIEVDLAIRDICKDDDEGRIFIPKGLAFVIYGSDWIGRQQLYCFPLKMADKPHFDNWKLEFESSLVKPVTLLALNQ